MLPLYLLDKKNQRTLKRITPDINALKIKYPNMQSNQEESKNFQKELSQLYKNNNYTGISGCITPFVSIFMVFVFYNVITRPLTFVMGLSPEVIDSMKNIIANQGVELSHYVQFGILDYLTNCNPETLASLFPDLNVSSIPNIVWHGISMTLVPSFKWPSVLIPVIAALSTFLSTLPMKLQNRNKQQIADVINDSCEKAMKGEKTLKISSTKKENEITEENKEIETPEDIINPENEIENIPEKQPKKISEEEINKLKKVISKFASWGFQIYSSILTIIISFRLPVVMAFYWVFRSILTLIRFFILRFSFREKEKPCKIKEN